MNLINDLIWLSGPDGCNNYEELEIRFKVLIGDNVQQGNK